MRKLKHTAVAAFAVVAAGAVLSPLARAQDAPRGDIAVGKQVYLAKACFTCHGRSGQGGGYTAPVPALARTALPFEAFKMQIRDPSNNMPAYSDAVLSDKEISDIYAFVVSLPGPRAPNELPILNN